MKSSPKKIKKRTIKKSTTNIVLNPTIVRKDFPLLQKQKSLHYLDNAATTQKPRVVIDALTMFYTMHNANTHRGIYKLSEEATVLLEDARSTFARFINADPEEIIFTKNSTEGFNQIASSIGRTFLAEQNNSTQQSNNSKQQSNNSKEHSWLKSTKQFSSAQQRNIVVTQMEHHSNFVPWQQLCLQYNLEFRVVPYDAKTHVLDKIEKYVDKNTLAVAFTAMSNVTGYIPDTQAIIQEIRRKNVQTIIVVDAAQFIAHYPLNVKIFDADFACFSAHKMYGALGVGIVYGKKSLLEKIAPFFYGGNMIQNVELTQSTWAESIQKFEAGTLDAAGIVASAKAVEYIQKKSYKKIENAEHTITLYALNALRNIPGLHIIGHNLATLKNASHSYGPVIGFTLKDIHPHDLASVCDQFHVCIRAGHHCAQPLITALGTSATARISIACYTTKEDIDVLVKAIMQAQKLLSR